MEQYYFIDQNGHQKGPVEANHLPNYGVTRNTQVWKQGMDTWQMAGTIPELSGFLPPVPAPPPYMGYQTPPPQPSPYAGYQAPSPQSPSYPNFDMSKKIKLTDDGVRTLIRPNMGADETESYYFYGIQPPSFGKRLLLGAFSAFANKHFVCNFTNKGIHFYGLTMSAKPKSYFFVLKSEIKSLTVNKGLMQSKIKIEYHQRKKMKIWANRKLRGIQEQGRNLEAIARMFGY